MMRCLLYVLGSILFFTSFLFDARLFPWIARKNVQNFNPAPGVETVCVFPKNPSKFVMVGEETEILVGMKNKGELSVKVVSARASIHLPFGHHKLIQNLPAKAFNNVTVPPSVQSTFLYIFAVKRQQLKPGIYALRGIVVYEIDKLPYQSTFYKGFIEVTNPADQVHLPTVKEAAFMFLAACFFTTITMCVEYVKFSKGIKSQWQPEQSRPRQPKKKKKKKKKSNVTI